MKLLFVIFFLRILPVVAQSPAGPYDFPIKPGTTAWAQLNTGKEMWEVCQIPDIVLKNLSTEALAITCMNYPLYGDYLASNDLQSGILRMIDDFNGLKELASRSDGAQKLMGIYAGTFMQGNMPPKSNHTPMEMPVLKENYLELLLSSAPFSTLLKEEEKEQLAKMAVQKYEEKQADLRFGNQSKRISLLLCAQMMNARISIDYKLRMRSKEYAEQFTEITSTEEMENFYQFIKTLLP